MMNLVANACVFYSVAATSVQLSQPQSRMGTARTTWFWLVNAVGNLTLLVLSPQSIGSVSQMHILKHA